jgi:hypothetical protein
MEEAVSESGNESVGESTSSGELNDFGISQELLDSFGIESGPVEKFSDNGKVESENEGGDTEEVNKLDDSNEDVDGQSETEANSDDKDLFELTHNGQVEKYSRDKITELAQKGLDYTKKTMSLSEEKKTFESQMTEWQEKQKVAEDAIAQKQQELSDLINIKQVWDYYLDHVKVNNPDLYDQIDEGFQSVNGQFNNPILKSQMEQLNQQMEMFSKQSQEQEFATIRKQFDSEYSELTEKFAEDFKKLGLKPNKDKILQTWQKIEGAEKNSVHDAFMLLHGQELWKAMKSKANLASTEKKVSSRKTAPTSGKVNPTKSNSGEGIDFRKMSYDQLAQAMARGELS